MHDRIHPEFTDKELAKLDTLAADDPSNDKKLATRLEIILSAEDGRIVKIGVAKTSGVTAFDVAALESVQRAQPFGLAPRAIASADGNVYVDWELRRDAVVGCSVLHSRPFLLGP
jgi:TonB family protein